MAIKAHNIRNWDVQQKPLKFITVECHSKEIEIYPKSKCYHTMIFPQMNILLPTQIYYDSKQRFCLLQKKGSKCPFETLP